MIALVLSRARHLLSHSVLGSSLAGDGLLVRLRSTSIGLLGIVTAVGLGLIAFIAQLGWPGVFNAPIPGAPHEAGAIHDAIALTRSAPQLASPQPGRALHARANAPSHTRRSSESSGPKTASGLGGPRQLGTSGSVQAPQPAAQPPLTPVAPVASEPAGQPVASTPAAPPVTASAPTVEGSPKSSSSGGDSKGDPSAETKSKWHGTASTQPKGETDPSGKSEVSPPSKPVGNSDPKTKAYPAPSKSTEYSPSKPADDAAPPKEIVPPVTSPAPKDVPEEGSFEKGKETGYAGKSDWRRH